MRRLSSLVLYFAVLVTAATAVGNDGGPSGTEFSWRVSACVRYLRLGAAASIDRARRTPSDFATRQNLRVIRTYERAQNYEIMRFGREHSQLTRYLTALPELAEMFSRRYPEWNRLYFVINSGEEFLFTQKPNERIVYPKNEVLAVWKDTHLVFKTMPGAVLDQVLLRRTPEKALMRAISKMNLEFE